jgi:hypothetical protein
MNLNILYRRVDYAADYAAYPERRGLYYLVAEKCPICENIDAGMRIYYRSFYYLRDIYYCTVTCNSCNTVYIFKEDPNYREVNADSIPYACSYLKCFEENTEILNKLINQRRI